MFLVLGYTLQFEKASNGSHIDTVKKGRAFDAI